ncbi:hypothetical protein JCM8097_001450 [Rhodosporidiobolus ruineniae]
MAPQSTYKSTTRVRDAAKPYERTPPRRSSRLSSSSSSVTSTSTGPSTPPSSPTASPKLSSPASSSKTTKPTRTRAAKGKDATGKKTASTSSKSARSTVKSASRTEKAATVKTANEIKKRSKVVKGKKRAVTPPPSSDDFDSSSQDSSDEDGEHSSPPTSLLRYTGKRSRFFSDEDDSSSDDEPTRKIRKTAPRPFAIRTFTFTDYTAASDDDEGCKEEESSALSEDDGGVVAAPTVDVHSLFREMAAEMFGRVADSSSESDDDEERFDEVKEGEECDAESGAETTIEGRRAGKRRREDEESEDKPSKKQKESSRIVSGGSSRMTGLASTATAAICGTKARHHQKHLRGPSPYAPSSPLSAKLANAAMMAEMLANGWSEDSECQCTIGSYSMVVRSPAERTTALMLVRELKAASKGCQEATNRAVNLINAHPRQFKLVEGGGSLF